MEAGKGCGLGMLFAGAVLVGACGQQGQVPAAAPVEVTTTTVTARDVPIVLQYVGQAESSRSVEIRARVEGYLQKKYFHEGVVVKQGDPLFLIEPRPLQLAAESAAAALKDRENLAQNARMTRERLKALLSENAVSKKDFDDAQAADRSAAAALAASRAEHSRAELSLSYSRITSPVTGLVGRSSLAEGSYVSPAANGLLTTVSQFDPIWVNFSISENEWTRVFDEVREKKLRLPEKLDFDVEMILPDGRTLARRGKINFASPVIDTQTGTNAVRATFPNPDLTVRPGQFVRVRLIGAVRPGAILVPQRAVMQGQTGKFVYVVGKDGKAEIQPLDVGDWHGNDWFVTAGLKGGEQIVVGGVVKVQPGAALKIVSEPAPVPAEANKAAPPPAK